jgi:adenine-specific DNA-methyltransferase
MLEPEIYLLTAIEAESVVYSRQKKTAHKKKYGQFFTDARIAHFMSDLFTIKPSDEAIEVLDCGAGGGILTVSLIHKLEKNGVKKIHITLYEIDTDVIPLLESNLSNTIGESKINITFEILQENFILADIQKHFDYIISNPPYFKLNKESPESKRMSHVIHGQPNIYSLFMMKSAECLKASGEMVFITPRSFTSGAYFTKLREKLFSTISLSNVHIFNSRTKHFRNESILQETIITKFIKQKMNQTQITVSEDSHFDEMVTIALPYNMLIAPTDFIIRIPTSLEDVETMKMFMKSEHTFASLGYKISTGKVVVFRNKEYLSSTASKATVPMLWMNHFKQEKLQFPLSAERLQYIINCAESQKLLIPCKNYIIIKRFSSKEQKRRINIGYIFKKDIDCNFLGLENHLNYIYKVDCDFNEQEMVKLGQFLSSEIVDKYFRIVNGNTQVNAGDIMNLPVPKELYEKGC